MSKVRDLFCVQLNKFSQDMRILLKDDSDAHGILDSLDAMIGISPQLVITFFKTYIAEPYEAQILKRDEAFLHGELHSKLGDNPSTPGPLDGLHHKIHDRWGSMSTKEKNAVWDYFKLLVLLSKRL